MSNTVITNYTDSNGPSTKADSSVVVIVNKDGSLSVDENVLGTLIGSEGTQTAGISVVRVGHDGRPDDATDSDSDDDNIPHVTLTVDSYFGEPNSIIKYDSGAEMLQSFRIESHENSLLGFQNDHCYTPIISGDTSKHGSKIYKNFNAPIIEIKQQSPPKSIPSSKKITILDQKIIPKGRRVPIGNESSIVLKGKDVLSKQITGRKASQKYEESADSSSVSSSAESVPDKDTDFDYKANERSGSSKKSKAKPRILKTLQTSKGSKLEPKVASRLKAYKNSLQKEIKEKISSKNDSLENIQSDKKTTPRSLSIQKNNKKEKKTPAHVSAMLSDMTSLFSTPDVIRRISTDGKTTIKSESKTIDEKTRSKGNQRIIKQKNILEKNSKGYEPMPQIDDASLAQILQDPPTKTANTNAMNSPSIAGPLSPTLDLLGGLQPEEEGLTEDLLMHVAQLVESSENLQEVIDKQVLGKVDTMQTKSAVNAAFNPGDTSYTPSRSIKAVPRKDPIEIVRRDGRVITLPPIEAPATRASKRKNQSDSTAPADILSTSPPQPLQIVEHIPDMSHAESTPLSKQYVNKKVVSKRLEEDIDMLPVDKVSAESQESWNSEDDPNRLWCICRQPHNNRFMICCDGCEDWFHGKCVNITKIMGQQMEERGIEWRCPNCTKKEKPPKVTQKLLTFPKKSPAEAKPQPKVPSSKSVDEKTSPLSKSSCIVCKKPARVNSIYCSDACILKHAQDSLDMPGSPTKPSTEMDKSKSESRVIVFERKTGRCLAGPNAPTAENLKFWLQKNPTFEVVRPGSLSAIKPGAGAKKPEPKRVQTTLNFEKFPKKTPQKLSLPVKSTNPVITPDKPKTPLPLKQEKLSLGPKTSGPKTPKVESPKASLPLRQNSIDGKRAARASTSRSQSTGSKASPSPAPSPSPSTSKIDSPSQKAKTPSSGSIRNNVSRALEEQMTIRMAETTGKTFAPEEIKEFVNETEEELYALFKDVGVKYKAKYRSLMFNIKDRKNLSLWQKICNKDITPKQLVRLSPEELASQELAQWRDQEAKHQLELIKKNELDLLAASKTYVLKTHKGEEVMETKVTTTELDPNVRVEDLVTALNDSTVGEFESADEPSTPVSKSNDTREKRSSRKTKESEKSNRDKRESERKSSRSTRYSDNKKDDRPSRRSERRSSKNRSSSKEPENNKERDNNRRSSRRKAKSQERRSRSSSKSKRRSRSKDRKRKRSRSRLRDSLDEKSSRSKSQDGTTHKIKKTDTIERAKSASTKETHPEYDPHEPMITSAVSEEDIGKSQDLYEESFRDMSNIDYDEIKSFTIMPSVKKTPAPPKPIEVESDQEPSSTVESSGATVWNGCINMVDVARFYVTAHEVLGSGADLEDELSAELDIVGRILPETVWDYINKMKRSGNKDITVLRLVAANDEEKMQYIALYSYLSTRSRLGVVRVPGHSVVKDLYIVPLSAEEKLPTVLGLQEEQMEGRGALLMGVLLRQRRKRAMAHEHTPTAIKVTRTTRSSIASMSALPAPGTPKYTPPALSVTSKSKLTTSTENEPYSPGSSSCEGTPTPVTRSTGCDTLRTKMEELNRQIEEQKQQIRKLTQTDTSADQNEAYSPSRPMTPSPPPLSNAVPLADIALPSNLHEILATIKQRETTHPDIDMRIKK